MYRLSERELSILGSIELNADLPVAQIAKAGKMKAHSAGYYIAKLRDSGVLGPRRASINSFLLGFSDFHFMFSLGGAGIAKRKQLIQYLKRMPSVAWFAEVGGPYQYAMSLRVKEVRELFIFTKSLARAFPGAIVGQELAVNTTICSYGRRYLHKSRLTPFKNRAEGTAPVAVDQVDLHILSGLSTHHCTSERELSRLIGIPLTTFRRRVARLEEIKIINGYYHHIDILKLGYQVFKLLIFSKSSDPVFLEQLEKFADVHPSVVHYLEAIGCWQAELVIEVREAREASAIAARLQEEFGLHIGAVHVIPIFSYLKAAPFPHVADQAATPPRARL